jgi:hypothetical protein
MKFKILLSLSLIFTLFACTSYENGPAFSLKSATTRITGEWELYDVIVNDKTEEILFESEKNIIYIFSEDGSLLVENNDIAKSSPTIVNGTWEFNKDKTVITLDINEESIAVVLPSDELTILRLTEDELWISDENSSFRSTDFITERRFTKVQ